MLLLLTLPMQGLSAVLMAFHCAPDGQHGEVAVGLQQHHQHVAHEHGSNSLLADQHEGDASSNDAGHSCGNHTCTGAPSVAAITVPDTAFVSINQAATKLPPFFRERLLRPPRT